MHKLLINHNQTFKVNNNNLPLLLLLLLVFGFGYVSADVSHLFTTEAIEEAANPYVFSYQAGRAPNHVDRQHTEVSDGSGVVRGVFSYVDPKNQVRTVQYVADKDGFHPQLSHQNEDSEAVKLAKQKHINLYNRIAHEHANNAPQNAANAHEAVVDASPANYAVLRATEKHLSLYERIAAEHAAIGAQHEAERKALQQQQQQQYYEQQQQQQVDYEHDPLKIPVAIRYE